jgi:DNA polymerase I-like protein with 3'-5' exonuclease and polymerase domains
MTADLMGISRKQAKGINLGLTYGMGGASLCRHLGLPTEWRDRNGRTWEAPGEEGQRLIDLYNERIPFAKILSDECKKRVNERGYIRTLLGRMCHWPEAEEGQRDRPFAHKALNRLIQGSAADQMKASMVMLWREHREVPLVTVHDELGFSAESEEHLARIRRCMEEAVTLCVPTIVDITTGRSWGDAKE